MKDTMIRTKINEVAKNGEDKENKRTWERSGKQRR